MKIYLNAYLQRNLGDDLFVHILLNRYKNHEFYSISTDTSYRNTYKNLHLLDCGLLVRILRKLSLKSLIASHCDMSVTLGGSMFMENKGDRYKNFSLGKKDHYILGINFGPYKTKKYFEKIKKHFYKAKDVCFRENYSYELFESLPHARIEPDIVFSLPLSDITITNEKHVVISVISCKNKISHEYEAPYIKSTADIANYFSSLNYKVTLMSFCEYEGDSAAIDTILPFVENSDNVHRYDYKGNIKEALQLLASASVIIGGRFHANVLGLLMNKAVIPFIYSDKTKNFLDDLGFNGLTVDIKKLDEFNLDMLNEKSLNYRLDVSDFVASAEKHFIKLDEKLLK